MVKTLFTTIFLFTISIFASGQCSLRDMTVSVSDCNVEGQFFATINLLHDETSDSFTLRGNGNNYGNFAYADLPIDIGPLTGDCDLEYEFEAIDLANDNCRTAAGVGKICCNGECHIAIVDFSSDYCDENGISMTFDLQTQNTGGLGFDVFAGNDFIAFYEYSQLPVTVEDFPSSGLATEKIIVCDNDNMMCCDTLIIETPCGCNIREIDVDIVDCSEENESFYASINAIPQMTSDSFILGGNTTTYGTFTYADMPVVVGPLPFSETTQYEFLILDKESSLCFDFKDVGIISGCEDISCQINDVSVTMEECAEDGTFYANLSIGAYAATSDSFIIRGNGRVYGTYAYGETIYQLGPLEGDCETIYEFVVIDQQNDGCQDFTVLAEPICCMVACAITDVRVDFDECLEDGTFFVNIAFDYNSSVSNRFMIRGNGVNYGTFEYGAESYRLGPLDGDCETIYEFVVIDMENEACQNFVDMEEAVCCAQPECTLKGITAQLDCNEGKRVIVDPEFSEVSADKSAQVRINDIDFGTYGYTEFPVTIELPEDITFRILIEVIDQTNESCIVETEIEKDCNDCEMGIPEVTFIECGEENEQWYKVNFDYARVQTDSFDVYVNGLWIKRYAYADLPVDVGPITIEPTNFVFEVVDKVEISCGNSAEIANGGCTSSLEELQAKGIHIMQHHGMLQIMNYHNEQISASIYNITGQHLFQGSTFENLEMNTVSWVPGIYIVKLMVENKVYVEKVWVY